MLFIIAWRNIWRNKMRSLVVMGAVLIGIWSIIFLMGVVNGMVESYIDKSIKNEVSHIKINHPKFIENQEIKYHLFNVDNIINSVSEVKGVKAVAPKTKVNAMIGTGHSSRGIRVTGIIPSKEVGVTGIQEFIVEGNYLTDNDKNKIIISERMAKRLKTKLRSKVVLTFQDLDNNITMGAFRVVGIFDTENNLFDDAMVFVRAIDLNRLLGIEDQAHEIALLVNDLKQIDMVQKELMHLLPNELVRNYIEVQPELGLFQQQIRIAGIIYMIIFMLALFFGIINTMLMAVLERIKELGMLMAVGMNRWKVFSMIVLETLFLVLFAAPIGLALGYFTTSYYHEHGFRLLFITGEGMRSFGFDNLVYTTVPTAIYFQLVLAITTTAIIGSIYPALKAIQLRPVDAIRGSVQSDDAEKTFTFLKFIKKKI